MVSEIHKRLVQAARGQRNVLVDYQTACVNVERLSKRLRSDKGRKRKRQENTMYEKALYELEICTRTLRIYEILGNQISEQSKGVVWEDTA